MERSRGVSVASDFGVFVGAKVNVTLLAPGSRGDAGGVTADVIRQLAIEEERFTAVSNGTCKVPTLRVVHIGAIVISSR